ncbi:terminase large subunit [Asticcacaulis sp.]|uniref:terminase large subunit n=1 Tax=Asticcacaulis sp. TaxID=1872648 RepID=UPI003F7C9569
MEWTTACTDWRERIVARQSLIPAPLFPDEAQAALDVFKGLRIVDAAGSPTFGESCEPWVFEWVAAIFGAYDKPRNKRLIKEFFLLISKKNSKSTIAAGVMVTALIRNWRIGAELILLAPTIEVAKNAWKPAVAMIRADPDLSTLLHIQESVRTITHLKTKAELKVIAADSGTVAGKKAGFVFVDELWEFGFQADAENMLTEATGGLASRSEGFVIYASTQSDKQPAGVFAEKLAYHRGVRDGEIDDPHSLPTLYEYPEAMIEAEAYLDPENWYVTNPNLGRSVDIDYLLQEKAKAFSPVAKGGKKQSFLAKHLNLEIGLRLSANRWRGVDYWEAAADPTLRTLEAILERSEVVTIGIDGGGLDDLVGLSVIGRERETRRWMVWAKAWAHSDVLLLRQDIATQLLEFESDGDLIVCDDPEQPNRDVAEIVAMIRDRDLLPAAHGVGLDPFCIAGLVDELAMRGIDGELLAAIRQGSALSPASWGSEIKLKNLSLRHGGSRLMNWCVGNAAAVVRGSAILITKETAGRAKIDPLVAMFNAVMLMSRNPEPFITRSVYEDRGIRSF